jgi:hypothetical protein
LHRIKKTGGLGNSKLGSASKTALGARKKAGKKKFEQVMTVLVYSTSRAFVGRKPKVFFWLVPSRKEPVLRAAQP